MSILNGMSKICEKYIHNSFSSFPETILSNFISAYKKSYSSNHVLLRLIENQKRSRDNKSFVGTVLMDPYGSLVYLLQNFMHMVHRGYSSFCTFILKT